MVVLSDDDASTELNSVDIKVEPRNAAYALEIGFIDLTDDIFEDSDIPRHYISWLASLMEKATIKPTIVEPPVEKAATSSSAVSIEHPTKSGQVSVFFVFVFLNE